MSLQIPKTQLALALTGVIAGFIAVSQVIRPGHALPIAALVGTDSGAASLARAQGPPSRIRYVDARPADGRAACRADFQQLCAGVERGQGRVIRCLVQRQADLSAPCRSFLQQIAARPRGDQ
jgi:cysteine rich repeat protein